VRLAIIDCGTNTFHLLIADTAGNGNYQKIFNTRVPVKLGEGTINSGFIAAAPFERGVNALHTFSQHVKEYKVDKVMAFATSAIRSASNGTDFAQKAKEQLGVDLEIIDGDREAELIYLGNRQALSLGEKPSLIMDIGGGSTEFILADHKDILWKQSYNLGAARILQKFPHSSPILPEETATIKRYLKENLASLFAAVKTYPPQELVGSSGAFDSVVEIIHGEFGGEPLVDSKTGYTIDLNNYRKVSELVKNADLEQRRVIKGLTPMRFDMIVISCLMIDFVLEEMNIHQMRVSTFSLKEGALFDFISRQT
jgi:exopolyphosphatase / guanosine-5'-triphosphate,3'-diphosphate pyrophosphatase